MKTRFTKLTVCVASALSVASLLTAPFQAFARDVEYTTGQGEVEVWVNVGEPTEIIFEGGKIKDGFKNSNAGIAIDKKDSSLVVFGKETMAENGEAILVRLDDGRSYPVRIRRANADNPRDAQIVVSDGKGALGGEEEEAKPFAERSYEYAPASKVSGLMREMVLVAEFGKKNVPGYTLSERYKGQTVVSDGSVIAKVDKIFIGPNLWGYVLDASNLLDQSQKINAATFRIDGTRAISASNWELAARPLNIEEQVSGKHNPPVYVVTRAR